MTFITSSQSCHFSEIQDGRLQHLGTIGRREAENSPLLAHPIGTAIAFVHRLRQRCASRYLSLTEWDWLWPVTSIIIRTFTFSLLLAMPCLVLTLEVMQQFSDSTPEIA